MQTRVLGTIYNPSNAFHEVNVPLALFVLGGAAIGTYVGAQMGGPYGAAVGALVGAFVGALAAGIIKRFKVVLQPNGKVEVEYETWVEAMRMF